MCRVTWLPTLREHSSEPFLAVFLALADGGGNLRSPREECLRWMDSPLRDIQLRDA